METGYDLEPRPLARSSRRRAWAVVGATVVFLVAVLVKPWAASPVPSLPAPQPTPIGPVARFVAAPRTPPVWPAAATPTDAANVTTLQAEGAIGALASRSGTWGVGDAGVGPRMLRDEPWTDWVRVTPESVVGGPIHIATWPDTDPCAGFATIYDSPSLVAITAPADLVPDWRLAGWWTDGNQVAPLTGSVRQVSPAGNRGISYLERTDRERWPSGRYEFHVIAGTSTLSMTLCLTRGG